MLKLLKYEFRKTRFMKVALVILTLISEIFFLIGMPTIEDTPFFVLGLMGLILCATFGVAICGLKSIDILHKELNSKQSYMLFMTPNNRYKILGAKVLESGISLLCSGVLFSVLAAIDLFILAASEKGVTDTLNLVMKSLGMVNIDPLIVLQFFAVLLGLWFSVIGIAYFAVVLQATFLNGRKWSGLSGFLIFIAVVIILGFFEDLMPSVGNTITDSVIQISMDVVATIGFYLATGWIMDKKLSV